MDILITGINGFVGSYLTDEWCDRYGLYGLDIRQVNRKSVKKMWSWDELGQVPTIDAIVHLAGIANDIKKTNTEQLYYQVNTGLTKKIFDFFLEESNAKTFVFFSSVKAAVDVVEGDILTEDAQTNPIGPYGESKVRAEEYIQSKMDKARKKNKKVFILRPCMIHGPGNKGNLNLLYQVVKKRIPWPLGIYNNRRSFCSIDNIIFVVNQLISNQNIESGIYHVCDDEALSTNELVELISETLGQKATVWKLPKWIIEVGASIGDVLHLPLTKERLTKLTENYVVSNAKIKSALGIDKMPVSAEEGLTKTIRSFANKK